MLNLDFGGYVCGVWVSIVKNAHYIPIKCSPPTRPVPYCAWMCFIWTFYVLEKKKDNKRVRAFIHTPFNFMSEKEKCHASICRYSGLINGALMCLDYVKI